MTRAMDSSAGSDREASPVSRWRNRSPTPDFPLKLSLTPDSTRSQSTSGSIPISPPPLDTHQTGPQIHRRPSLFAQIIPPILNKLPKFIKGGHSTLSANLHADLHLVNHEYDEGCIAPASRSPLPLAGATVVATRAEAEAAFHTAPLSDNASAIETNDTYKRAESSTKGVQGMAAASVVRVGGRMATIVHPFQRRVSERDTAKGAVWSPPNAATTLARPTTLRPSISLPIHHDVRKPSRSFVDDTSLSVAQKRPSLFAHMVDMGRESRASKRREELKRSIRIVPGVPTEALLPEQKRGDGGGEGEAHRWL